MEKVADIVETAELSMPEEIITMDDTSPMDNMVIVEEPAADYSKTQDPKHFMAWLKKEKEALPPHSGKTTAGCERFLAKINMLDKEISKAVSRDLDCVLDDQEVEEFRKELRKMKRLVSKRHKEINDAYDADDAKYAANENTEIVKEADDKQWVCKKCDPPKYFSDEEHYARHMAMEHGGAGMEKAVKSSVDCGCSEKVAEVIDEKCPTCKITLWKAAEGLYECLACDGVFKGQIKKEAATPRVQLVMTPWERAITGMIVNGIVANGRNAEEIYAELKKEYKFSNRDELSITQLLVDLGYPIARNFITPLDKNIEFATNYSA